MWRSAEHGDLHARTCGDWHAQNIAKCPKCGDSGVAAG